MRHDPNFKRFLYRPDVQGTYDRETGNTIIGQEGLRPESPLLMDITVSTKCSGGCSFCYQDATPDGKEADVEEVLEGISRISPLPFQVALGGGEPANWPHLWHFVDEMDRLGIDVSMTVGPGISDDGMMILGMVTQSENLKAVGVSYHQDERLFCHTLEECNGKAVAHIVLHRGEMADLAKKFKDRWWPDDLNGVVFLLPKPVGRGTGLVPPSVRECEAFIREAVIPWFKWYGGTRSVAVDPCLGVALPDLPSFLMSGCDGGRYSMYWNAVRGTMSRCSFLKNEEVPWDGSSDDFKRIWNGWSQVEGCKYKPR